MWQDEHYLTYGTVCYSPWRLFPGCFQLTGEPNSFYDVQKGRILCNGENISDMNVYSYRNNLSLVAQEPTLFQGSIRDNILLGVDPDTVTEEQLHQVCRDASIHDFIV